MAIPARFAWAATVIDAAATDHILEIGCGAGLLVASLAEGLTTGIIVALDRSQPMITRAAKRNEEWITTKKVNLLAATLYDAPLPDKGFHKIVAFNVNYFWKTGSPELALVKKFLKPGGKLYVFHQAPATGDRKTVPAIKAALKADDWKVVDTQSKIFEPAPAYAVIAAR
ncbi:class I SAM-dependent methyltransferase [Dawidia soli]|uniref:Methyltransferase domain-containing protein n=1 Tax=Dawidia soli TaxID=2782352 RepID=A0AAP2GGG1_9BACT|nr:class I SAM-dependent methyltransferase [Dawidia soli]MBT1686091.1 methyltransferase domain-containing protein [Dawidia soli]